MAKYIDLLREQQKSSPSGKKKRAGKGGTTDSDDVSEELDAMQAMLPDESGMNEKPAVTSGENEHDELLVDEEGGEVEAYSTPAFSEPDQTAQQLPEDDIGNWLMQSTQAVTLLFQAASSDKKVDIQSLTAKLNLFLDRISDDPTRIDALELAISQREKQIGELDSDLGSLIQKSIMMMLYAIKMGVRLKLNMDVLRSHILAAMLHHIGMSQISAETRNRKEKLSEAELKEIRQAPKRSHDYLKQCGITDAAILQAAAQAQERFDGSGPQEMTGSEIAFSARMIGLLSMFEALIHYRPYRNRLLPRDAIRELVNHHKKAFDPIMLKALIESISLYPVGTYVQLNSGDVGLVIQVHPKLPLRPLVRVLFNSRGEEIAAREIDLKNQPNLMVRQCMYEENLSDHWE